MPARPGLGAAQTRRTRAARRGFRWVRDQQRVGGFVASAHDFLAGRIRRLRERIELVQRELSKRSTLHESFEAEIEGDIQDLSVRVTSMSYPEIRQELDNELRKLKKDRRNNAARAWKDALDLSDRLLELVDEYERLLTLEHYVEAGRRAG